MSIRLDSASVETRFANHVRRQGLNWQSILLDLDKLQSGYVNSTAMRRFFELSSFALTDSEYSSVFSKYDEKRNGLINYRAFLIAAKLYGSDSSSTPRVPYTSRSSQNLAMEVNHDEAIASVKRCLSSKDAKLRAAFTEYDKVRTGLITQDQFQRALEKAGVKVSDAELEYFFQRYESKQLPKHVEWSSFCDDVDATPYGITVGPKPRTPPSPRAPGTPKSARSEIRRSASRSSFDKATALRKVTEALKRHNQDIHSLIRDVDESGDGYITPEQLREIFDSCGVHLSENEFSSLVKDYIVSEYGQNVIQYLSLLSEFEQTVKSSLSKEQGEALEMRVTDRFSRFTPQEINDAFQSCGTNVEDHVDMPQFKQVLSRFMTGLSDDEIQHILQRANALSSDGIHFRKFVAKYCISMKDRRATIAPTGSLVPQLKLTPRPPPGPPQNISLPSNSNLNNIQSPEVKQAIARVQLRLVDSKARIVDFLKDYDRLRCGLITDTQFRRGLDLSGVRLSDAEIKSLLDYYQGRNEGTVQWSRFCDDVDSVFTIKHLERTPRHPLQTGRSELKYQAAASRAPQVDAIVQNVLNRLQEVISRQRIIPLPPFQDFDRMHCRRVTVTQFQQSLAILGLSIKEVEMEAIVTKYGIEFDGLMTVKYREFLDDLKSADKYASDHAHLARLEQILREKIVQNVGGSGHLRKAFRFFDRDMTGQITEIQFGNVCRQLGMNLTDEEVKGLMCRYDIDQDGTIDYHEFIDRLLPKDYGMEKAPTASVVKQVEIPTFLPRTINTSTTELPLLLAKLKAHILAKDIRLRDFFADFDIHRRCLISREQFQRGLYAAGFRLEDEEVQVLIDNYVSREPDLIRWTLFVDDICSALIPKDLERNPCKEVKYVHPRDLIMESLGGSPPETLELETRSVMKRIGEEVANRRILDNIRTLFGDFDHHHVRQVTVDNLLKVMKHYDISLSQKDVEILVARYGEVVDGVVFFRYADFLTDLRDAGNWDNPRIKKILEKIREKVAQRITGGHFEIRRAFRCFDRDGSGQITESEFKEMLVNYAINVTEEDLHELVKYIDSEGRGYVGFNDFIDKCLPKDYSGSNSAAPESGRSQRDTSIAMSKKTHTPRAPVDVDGLIQKLVHYVAEHRIRITDFLKSDDIHNLGCISVDQFHRALTATGFRIDSREAEAVAHRFMHPRHPGSVDWVAFANKIESNFVVPDLERAPRSDPTGSYESKGRFAAKEISPEREEEMNNLLARIQREITRARMTPKQYFQDFDRVRVNRITR
eukprot:TRINITY_DN1224_c0_g1_i7.p1 TRINITY_DN1224_c0_g1~~TRINITY_DN1224_c0_g1_i7.p1  ORF type:complete len:1276 (+),score=333.18 TRINITY_DN1224_c0_g1_i7:143-3970(+)